MVDIFENIIVDFKASESPESVLVVGDGQDRIKLVLAWPNVPINRSDALPRFDERWSIIHKWQWLWQCVQYRPLHYPTRACGEQARVVEF